MMNLIAKKRKITFPRRPLIMGIINVNDDSFCGDGSTDVNVVVSQTLQLIADGADVIDVGAESARTNREAISIQEEIQRFSAYLSRWQEICDQAVPRDEQQVFPPLLSICLLYTSDAADD